VETSRVDGVKAPQHRGTPRSHDVVVDRLGHADDGHGVVVALQVLGDLRGLGIGVVAADRVEDGHLVHHELLGRAVQGVFSLHHETALHAVLDIGQFHSRIADRASAMEL